MNDYALKVCSEEIKMKKVFRQPILFIISARFFLLLMIGGMLFAMGGTCLFVLPHDPVFAICALIVMTAMLIMFLFVVNPYLWPIAWGKIIVTPTHVIWRCLFYKSVKIAFADVKIITTRTFLENYARNVKVEPEFLFITDGQPVPYKRIDKVKTRPGFIKFFYDAELEKYVRKAFKEAQAASNNANRG